MIVDRWDEKLADAIWDYGPGLPLTITEDSKSRTVRILGLAWFFAWFFPVMIILAIPLLMILYLSIICDVWRGDL